jgi:hypothetical protein
VEVCRIKSGSRIVPSFEHLRLLPPEEATTRHSTQETAQWRQGTPVPH